MTVSMHEIKPKRINLQLMFSVEHDDMRLVRENLAILVNDLIKTGVDYHFYWFGLNRAMVQEKGWSTEAVDILDELGGSRVVYVADDYESATAYLKGLSQIRANMVSKLYGGVLLGLKLPKGVAEEVSLLSGSVGNNILIRRV